MASSNNGMLAVSPCFLLELKIPRIVEFVESEHVRYKAFTMDFSFEVQFQAKSSAMNKHKVAVFTCLAGLVCAHKGLH